MTGVCALPRANENKSAFPHLFSLWGNSHFPIWRSKWAELANKYLSENEIADRIDHRSFERQGTEQIPTIHLGVAASQMERKGIATERGNINREIKAHNKLLAQIKAKITSLKRWISEYISSAEKDTEKTDSLADLVSRADIIPKINGKRCVI